MSNPIHRWWRRILASAVGAFLVASCGGPGSEETAPPPDTVVASVGSATLTSGELTEKLTLLRPADVAQTRKRIVNDWVTTQLLAAEAYRRGLDKLPIVRNSLNEVMAGALSNQVAEDANGPLTEEDVRQFFTHHVSDYATPERFRLRELLRAVGGNAPERPEARTKMQAMQKELAANEARASAEAADHAQYVATLFQDVARQDPAKLQYRETGLVTREELRQKLPPEAMKEAVGLDSAHPLSGVIETSDGLRILELIERLAPDEPSLENPRFHEQVRKAAARWRRDHAVSDLLVKMRSSGGVVVNEKVLEEIKVAPPVVQAVPRQTHP